jgi:hypothetical protein
VSKIDPKDKRSLAGSDQPREVTEDNTQETMDGLLFRVKSDTAGSLPPTAPELDFELESSIPQVTDVKSLEAAKDPKSFKHLIGRRWLFPNFKHDSE